MASINVDGVVYGMTAFDGGTSTPAWRGEAGVRRQCGRFARSWAATSELFDEQCGLQWGEPARKMVGFRHQV
jgi:hypothetical protein